MSLLGWSGDDRTRRSHSLLLALCRRNVGRESPGDRLAELSDRGFRESFLELAGNHRVLGLVASAVPRAAEPNALDEAAQAELSRLLLQLRRRAAMFELRQARVLDLLHHASVEALVLKGAALAGVVYDEPCQRDMDDLDLLVRPDQLKPAIRALRGADYRGPRSFGILRGFRRHHFHIPMELPGVHYVEMHWALARTRGVFQLDRDVVLDGAVRVDPAGAPGFNAPRPEHMLLHIVLQNLQEGFSRLARQVDIDRIVSSNPDLDWDLLVATARRGELASSTALSLRLATWLLGTEVPQSALRELLPHRVARFHLALMRPVSRLLEQELRADYAAKHLLELWLVTGLKNPLLLLARILVPDPETTLFQKEGLGVLRRILRLGKLVFLQIATYLTAPVALLSAGNRGQMRFWSSHASSSDRL